MIRKKKKYLKPRQMFESERIKEENELKEKYGLKNKREIWKTLAKVTYFRHRVKDLTKRPLEEQEVFFNKLKALGLKIEGTADVLGLKVEDLLKRRLPTIVTEKKLAHTIQQARQMVVHKKILVNGKVMNTPSYLVSVAEESAISIKKKIKKAKAKVEEKPLDSPQEGAPQQSEEAHGKSESAITEQPAEETPKEKIKEEVKGETA